MRVPDLEVALSFAGRWPDFYRGRKEFGGWTGGGSAATTDSPSFDTSAEGRFSLLHSKDWGSVISVMAFWS